MKGMTYYTPNGRHIGVGGGLGGLYIIRYLEESTKRKRYNQLPISYDPKELQDLLDKTAAAKGWQSAGKYYIPGTGEDE